MAQRRRMKDGEVITAFVAFLAQERAAGLRVDRWPDKEKDGDIDAVAGNFAIEHTSIDTFPDQRRDGAWVTALLAELESEIRPTEDLYVVFANDAVRCGQDWSGIRGALRNWLQTEPHKLTSGPVVVQIPGVPFDVTIYRTGTTVLPPRVFFGRFTPADSSLPERIQELCDRKLKKLTRYKDEGRVTLLLLENDDLANMNHFKLAQAIRDAYPTGRPVGLDELWYVSPAIQPELYFLDLSNMWMREADASLGRPVSWRAKQ